MLTITLIITASKEVDVRNIQTATYYYMLDKSVEYVVNSISKKHYHRDGSLARHVETVHITIESYGTEKYDTGDIIDMLKELGSNIVEKYPLLKYNIKKDISSASTIIADGIDCSNTCRSLW